jgi:hypothetical protein
MLAPLFAVLAFLGIGAAAAATTAKAAAPGEPPRPIPKKKVRRIVRKVEPKEKPKSKVVIKKKPLKKKVKKKIKAKRPPTRKEVEAAKKIKEAKVVPNKQGKKIIKKLTEIVKPTKKKKKAHPIVRQEAKKKLAKIAKPGPNLAEIAKQYRAVQTVGFPYVYKSKKTGQKVWCTESGANALRAKGTHTWVTFRHELATAAQKRNWNAAMQALKPKPAPSPKKREARKEIIKTVVKVDDDTPPTPKQAARALQIYTKEGHWQGDKSRPSKIVRDCQKHMGDPAPDGIVGPGTRARAKDLGYPLYTREQQRPGAWKEVETF